MKKVFTVFFLLLTFNLYSVDVKQVVADFTNTIRIPNLYGEFSVELITKNGDKRKFEAEAYQKLISDNQMNRLFKFKYPPKVRDTGLLIHSYLGDGEENKMWMYLPVLKKVKRISLSSSGGGNFMGSDFSYTDLISSSDDNFEHVYTGDKTVDNRDCYMIEQTAKSQKQKEAMGYEKIINFYGKSDSFLYARDYYDAAGDLAKTYRVKEVKVFGKQIYPNHIVMTNVQTDHKSIIRVDNIKTEEISDKIFTTRNLKK